ncbi:ABC transporter permease [Mesorhizobium sp. B2-5-4]|uniref:ABC transporter permease n=1 Tax=unclassified Mesorhizobium TaxID=325217 RepID=UPI00112EC4E5|nr:MULTISPECIES: ABC transporter permease [unclassified Mesorhizobium]TPJ45103.1 ABC transporter permease [Mesorhizobium sp. B2-6-5]TPJ91526.1 ABC transporter permease [Mesorhizobium sp. B2-5-13]TPK48683.1 ABC transporter permease [Mesorhizobium sp. B2-5-4]TPK50069.1 ABC transporter permease [Mesorhizobium sp. B2-5-5]TPL79478.1 ABC transporter permease [Mesorhizobium sp. B2-3-13]
MTALKLLSRTKLYWGLIAIFLIGVLGSPVSSKGNNIFLSYGNLLDVLRQVSTTGLIATGMTAVIITGGIDLSVGSLMAICSVVCAMLLTVPGVTPGVVLGVPTVALVALCLGIVVTRFILLNLQKSRAGSDAAARDVRLDTIRGLVTPAIVGVVLCCLSLWYLLPQIEPKFGVLGVLLVAPCVGLLFGAINGFIIVGGRLQPFIVTLAMMVTALGIARLTAGQNNAVLPVYTGSNATADFELLRSLVFGVIPMPGLFFLGAIVIYGAVLRFTPFGRYVYAIGGNEEAARLSGIAAGRVKIATYAISGLLAGIAAVLYVAQYRQGKPDAGAGLELDAIAAVVIGGTSLMGGRGSLIGTFCGVLIFGLLSNILQLHNINSNLQLVLKGMIIIGTVLVQERNAGDLLAYLRLPGAAHKETAAAKRPSQETPSLNLGGNKK